MLTTQLTTALERAIYANGRTLSTTAAREFLQWNLSVQDSRRIDELGAKSRQVGLTEKESAELEQLCSTLDLISALHLLAKEALGELPGA